MRSGHGRLGPKQALLVLQRPPTTVGGGPHIAQIPPGVRAHQARISDTKSGTRSWSSESVYLSSIEAPFNEVVGELQKDPTRGRMRIVGHFSRGHGSATLEATNRREQALKYSG